MQKGEYDKDRIIIVGGGIIGLCAAYHCLESGRPVTVIDTERSIDAGCSYGNAGMVVPSHFIPLAAPGIVGKGLKWLANPEGPFYIRPRASVELMRWCKIFMTHATSRHVMESRELLRDLNLESRRIFVEMAQDIGCELVEKGLLMLCRTEKGLAEEAEVAEMAEGLGLDAELCSPARLHELDPGVEMDVKGGVWFKQDCHLDPAAFIRGLRQKIISMGAEIVPDTEVTGLRRTAGGAVQLEGVSTPPGLQVVLACGAWTGDLLRTLGLRMPMQAGKGYSLTLEQPGELPELCSILCEAKVAVTPMGQRLRFAGTMEICGNDLSVNARRVHGIIRSAQKYFPGFCEDDFSQLEPWAGLRPCSPDGLPYVGRVAGCANLTVATGHSMMGVSLGPVTGRLIAQLVAGSEPCIDIRRLNPLRFGS